MDEYPQNPFALVHLRAFLHRNRWVFALLAIIAFWIGSAMWTHGWFRPFHGVPEPPFQMRPGYQVQSDDAIMVMLNRGASSSHATAYFRYKKGDPTKWGIWDQTKNEVLFTVQAYGNRETPEPILCPEKKDWYLVFDRDWPEHELYPYIRPANRKPTFSDYCYRAVDYLKNQIWGGPYGRIYRTTEDLKAQRLMSCRGLIYPTHLSKSARYIATMIGNPKLAISTTHRRVCSWAIIDLHTKTLQTEPVLANNAFFDLDDNLLLIREQGVFRYDWRTNRFLEKVYPEAGEHLRPNQSGNIMCDFLRSAPDSSSLLIWEEGLGANSTETRYTTIPTDTHLSKNDIRSIDFDGSDGRIGSLQYISPDGNYAFIVKSTEGDLTDYELRDFEFNQVLCTRKLQGWIMCFLSPDTFCYQLDDKLRLATIGDFLEGKIDE